MWKKITRSSQYDVSVESLQNSGTESTTSSIPKELHKFPKSGDPVFKNPDIYSSPEEVIKAHGFMCETHEIEVADGYIVSCFRIPYGKNFAEIIPKSDCNKNQKEDYQRHHHQRPIALFAHGILTSGASWILNTDENVLPYQLTEKGYDCWLLNARGCEYSRKHTTLKTNTRKFWKFSWDQMAKYDLPAIINYILKMTDQENLFYIAHSMGNCMLFGAVSLYPELASKIKLMIAYAPAVYIQNARTLFIKATARIPGAQAATSCLRRGEFPLRRSTSMAPALSPWLWFWKSRRTRDSTWFCHKILNHVNGYDREKTNWSMLPVLAGHIPSPTSVQTYTHFLQMHKSGRFCQYDFGRSANIKKYGQEKPPAYDLSKSTFPVALFFGDNDSCVQPKDCEKLANELPNVILNHRVDWPKFNHLSFLCGKDIDKLLNVHVINLLEKYL